MAEGPRLTKELPSFHLAKADKDSSHSLHSPRPLSCNHLGKFLRARQEPCHAVLTCKEVFGVFFGDFQRLNKCTPWVMHFGSDGPGAHGPASQLGPKEGAVSSCGWKTTKSHFLPGSGKKSAINKQPTNGSCSRGDGAPGKRATFSLGSDT